MNGDRGGGAESEGGDVSEPGHCGGENGRPGGDRPGERPFEARVAKDDYRAEERADGGGNGAIDGVTGAFARGDARDVRREKEHEEQHRQKDANGSQGRAGESRDEVADESDGDDHRAWGKEPDGDGVEELPVGQPVMLGDDASI